jgi:single-strand DNA-binding protein
MLNHITIMGRIVREIELRRTGSGLAVANFTVAVDRDRSGQDGNKETDFIDCVAWRQTAEFVSKYFGKGRMIVVSGRLQITKYTDRDGNKRSRAEVVADNCYFGDSKKDAESAGVYTGGYSAPSGGAYDSTLAYAEQLAGKREGFDYPYPAKTVDASDFTLLEDDDAMLPF